MPSTAAAATTVSGTRTADVGSLPQHGDVVVTREGGSAVAFTIRQLPGGAQVSAGLREKALHLARGFAQKHGVDLWYCEHGTNRLLEVYRTRARRQDSAGGSSHS